MEKSAEKRRKLINLHVQMLGLAFAAVQDRLLHQVLHFEDCLTPTSSPHTLADCPLCWRNLSSAYGQDPEKAFWDRFH